MRQQVFIAIALACDMDASGVVSRYEWLVAKSTDII